MKSDDRHRYVGVLEDVADPVPEEWAIGQWPVGCRNVGDVNRVRPAAALLTAEPTNTLRRLIPART
jgi:hypothetical protein